MHVRSVKRIVAVSEYIVALHRAVGRVRLQSDLAPGASGQQVDFGGMFGGVFVTTKALRHINLCHGGGIASWTTRVGQARCLEVKGRKPLAVSAMRQIIALADWLLPSARATILYALVP